MALLLSASAVAAPSPTRVRFMAAGDFAQSTTTTAPVLQAMSDADADLALALGDLSYGTVGQESSWCDFVTSRVGAGFPFELLSGNHESNGQNGNINDFSACLPNQLPGLVGTYGRQYYVDVPQQDPLVRFIMISPNIPFPDSTWSYNAGTARYQWTADRIDGARAAGIPWVVVGMHKPCLSLGEYACEPGADIMNLLVDRRVDLVLNGHEHLYQRTKQLAQGPGCTTIVPGTYNAACVADADDQLTAGRGTVFVTAGTGGRTLRAVDSGDTEASYFRASMGSTTNATYGFSLFDATPDGLDVSFVRGTGGTFTDSFHISRLFGVNQPPTPAFTFSTQALTASFDASDSSDVDGTIASYAWDFGDGSTGTGRTTQHTYASAGTYPVTLTVTDDDGSPDQLQRQVTVTAPGQTTVLASDDFERTANNSWGSADTGGPWTVSTAAGVNSVSGGKGRMVMTAPGKAPVNYLNGVSATDVDVRLELAVDKRPVGTNARVDVSAILRRTATGHYRVNAHVYANGSVQGDLSTVVGSTQTMLGSRFTVSGITYNAGDTLQLRAQAIGTSPTQLRMKVWRTGSPEPTAWNASVQDSTSANQSAGSVGLTAYLGSSATNAPVAALFDAFRVVRPTAP